MYNSETHIYTHKSLDLDNASTVSFLCMLYDIPMKNIHFMEADWNNPEDLQDILIVDMFSGIKGESKIDSNGNAIILSAFSSILQKLGSPSHKKAFKNLEIFIDAQDSTGDWRRAYPDVNFSQEVSGLPTILTVFYALKNIDRDNDFALLQKWYSIIYGIQQSYNMYILARREAKNAEWYEGFPIAIMRNQKYPQTTRVLFGQGAKVIIYTRDYNIGVVRSNMCNVNLGDGLKEFFPSWFCHPAGFLVCWGSWKAPKAADSGVDPLMLAELVSRLL